MENTKNDFEKFNNEFKNNFEQLKTFANLLVILKSKTSNNSRLSKVDLNNMESCIDRDITFM